MFNPQPKPIKTRKKGKVAIWNEARRKLKANKLDEVIKKINAN